MKVNLEIIKEKRKENNFNIDEMARKLNLTNGSMYYKREAGQYKFKPEELMMVSKILKIPMNKLFLSNRYSEIEIAEDKQII